MWEFIIKQFLGRTTELPLLTVGTEQLAAHEAGARQGQDGYRSDQNQGRKIELKE